MSAARSSRGTPNGYITCAESSGVKAQICAAWLMPYPPPFGSSPSLTAGGMPTLRSATSSAAGVPVTPTKVVSNWASQVRSRSGVSRSGSVETNTTWTRRAVSAERVDHPREIRHVERTDVGAVGIAEEEERQRAAGLRAEIVWGPVGLLKNEAGPGERLDQPGRLQVLGSHGRSAPGAARERQAQQSE